MRLVSVALFGLVLLVSFAAVAEEAAVPPAIGDCAAPEAPTIPDGEVAPASDIRAASADVKAFQAAANTYTACLDEHKLALGEEITDEEEAALVTAHNTMVDQLEGVAADFNEALTSYKAKRAVASEE